MLGHAFQRPELLRQALTHRSFGVPHNERLEFIGDSVLNCVIADALFKRFPELPEGELSRVRANLVNRGTLSRLAKDLDLGRSISVGQGEHRSGGTARPSILADTLEALFGAVFVDAGFDAARHVVLGVYAADLAHLDPSVSAKDPKTRLQELLQGRGLPVPEYTIVGVEGEAHAQTFEVACRIPGLDIDVRGSGASRRAAEQVAAANAYARAANG
jgi:ribonuclease III